jgi:alpha-beta hydrolase superfamily lysophospholipase
MRTILAVTLSLTGCASTLPCVGELPASTATRTASRLEAADQTCLQRQEWAATGAPKGVVIIAHGLRDHGARYAPLVDALTARGFQVFAQDMRGHGQSGGTRQRWNSFDELMADLDLEVQAAHAKFPGLPVFLYGHSLGGLLTFTYASTHASSLDGFVLTGPALKLMPNVSDGDKSGARFFSSVLPGLKVQALDDSVFVRTAEARAEFMKDPLVTHENLPARSAAAAIDTIDLVAGRIPEMKLPFLVMHGTADVVTNIEGSRALATGAASTDKQLKEWPELAHDLLHEPEHDQVIAFAADWFTAHVKH